jgi:hypothetical protein
MVWNEINPEGAKSNIPQRENSVTKELESLAAQHKFDHLSQELHAMPWSERNSVVHQIKIEREQKEKTIPGFPELTFTNDGELGSVNHVAHTAKNGIKELYSIQYDSQTGNRDSKSIDWQNPLDGKTGHTDVQYNTQGKEVSAYQTAMSSQGVSITTDFAYNPVVGKELATWQFSVRPDGQEEMSTYRRDAQTGNRVSQHDAYTFADGAFKNVDIQFAANGKAQSEQESWANSYGVSGTSDDKFDPETGKRVFLREDIVYVDGTMRTITEQDDLENGGRFVNGSSTKLRLEYDPTGHARSTTVHSIDSLNTAFEHMNLPFKS